MVLLIHDSAILINFLATVTCTLNAAVSMRNYTCYQDVAVGACALSAGTTLLDTIAITARKGITEIITSLLLTEKHVQPATATQLEPSARFATRQLDNAPARTE